MSDEADVHTGVVVAEDKQIYKEGGELGENGSLAGQVTVMMADKIPTLLTPCKGGNKELNLSELGSSPTGSFQSLQSSQSSDRGSGMSITPLVGGTRVLKFEDTLSEEDCRNFKLIYVSLLLEGRAGNLTNLTLEIVLDEKPPSWLPVMYERLKHLIINADIFRKKMRIGHFPQIGRKGKKSSERMGKQQRDITFVENRKHDSGKGNRHTRTPGNNLRSCSAIGNQKYFDLICWI